MRKLTALLSAAALLLSAMPVFRIAAEETPDYPALPDWFPQTYEEAVEFRNTYGGVHIEGGLIGVVVCEAASGANVYRVEGTYDRPNSGQGAGIAQFTLDAPLSDQRFDVALYQPAAGTDFSVRCIRTYNGNDYLDAHYCFSVDDDNAVTETDLYAWVPDCITEYEQFTAEFGAASVHDRYIVYCTEVNYSTGANLQMTQNGSAEIEQLLESDCSEVELTAAAPGTPSNLVNVYDAISDGTVKITWTVGRAWDPESFDNQTEKTYEISEFTNSIREVSDVQLPAVAGDVDGDGSFRVSDVVALQKWLLGIPEITLANPPAGDLNADGELDVFDLSLMKRALLTTPPAPAENPCP